MYSFVFYSCYGLSFRMYWLIYNRPSIPLVLLQCLTSRSLICAVRIFHIISKHLIGLELLGMAAFGVPFGVRLVYFFVIYSGTSDSRRHLISSWDNLSWMDWNFLNQNLASHRGLVYISLQASWNCLFIQWLYSFSSKYKWQQIFSGFQNSSNYPTWF